jgi:hypothetical protein
LRELDSKDIVDISAHSKSFNFGFCFEHGHCVDQYIESAADSHTFISDHVHPSGGLNCRRFFRLLRQWQIPEESDCIAEKWWADDHLSAQFPSCLDDDEYLDRSGSELITSIERLKATLRGSFDLFFPEWDYATCQKCPLTHSDRRH